jgi:hypothetical protein
MAVQQIFPRPTVQTKRCDALRRSLAAAILRPMGDGIVKRLSDYNNVQNANTGLV